MPSIIAFLLLLGSGVGVFVITFRKIPLLAIYNPPVFDSHIFDRVVKNIKERRFATKVVPNEILLVKLLSKALIYILKVENKIAIWLNRLRQKSIEKSKTFTEGNYWEQLKEKRKRGRKPKKHIDNFTPLF